MIKICVSNVCLPLSLRLTYKTSFHLLHMHSDIRLLKKLRKSQSGHIEVIKICLSNGLFVSFSKIYISDPSAHAFRYQIIDET